MFCGFGVWLIRQNMAVDCKHLKGDISLNKTSAKHKCLCPASASIPLTWPSFSPTFTHLSAYLCMSMFVCVHPALFPSLYLCDRPHRCVLSARIAPLILPSLIPISIVFIVIATACVHLCPWVVMGKSSLSLPWHYSLHLTALFLSSYNTDCCLITENSVH